MGRTASKKPQLTPQQKEFAKVKRFILKRFPNARTEGRMVDGVMQFTVVDGSGRSVVDPTLFLPPARTVVKAWEQAKYAHWFSNMIRKSNNAFSDEKIYRKLAKESGGE